MVLIVTDNRKEYEKPANGQYIGVLVDTADLGKVQTNYGIKNKVRLVWLLGNVTGGFALDKEGNPFRVMLETNSSMNEKSTLFKAVRDIIGAAPATTYDIETLIGRNNLLFVVNEMSQKGKLFANIKAILPLAAGMQPLAVPANFIRHKDKKPFDQYLAEQRQKQGVAAGNAPAVAAAPFTPAAAPAAAAPAPAIASVQPATAPTLPQTQGPAAVPTAPVATQPVATAAPAVDLNAKAQF